MTEENFELPDDGFVRQDLTETGQQSPYSCFSPLSFSRVAIIHPVYIYHDDNDDTFCDGNDDNTSRRYRNRCYIPLALAMTRDLLDDDINNIPNL